MPRCPAAIRWPSPPRTWICSGPTSRRTYRPRSPSSPASEARRRPDRSCGGARLSPQLAVQPSPGGFPVPLYRVEGDIKTLCDLLFAQAAEKPEFHHLCLARIDGSQGGEGFVQRDKIQVRVSGHHEGLIQRCPVQVPSALPVAS